MLTIIQKHTPLAVVAVLLLSGCWKATFYQNPQVVRGATHDEWSDFFIFGLVGSETFDVRDFCGASEVAEVRTGGNVGTVLASILTLGIYAPRKVYVSCAATSSAVASTPTRSLELHADNEGRPLAIRVTTGERSAWARIARVDAKTFRVHAAEGHAPQEVTP